MIKKFIYKVLIIIVALTSNAHAYLDPGTGSIILQAILGFIAAALTTLSFYWNKFKMFISKLFKKDKKRKRN